MKWNEKRKIEIFSLNYIFSEISSCWVTTRGESFCFFFFIFYQTFFSFPFCLSMKYFQILFSLFFIFHIFRNFSIFPWKYKNSMYTSILTYTFTLPVIPFNSVSHSLIHLFEFEYIYFIFIITQIKTTRKFLSENSYNTKFPRIAWNTFSFFSPSIFSVRVYILSSTLNIFFKVKEFSIFSYTFQIIICFSSRLILPKLNISILIFHFHKTHNWNHHHPLNHHHPSHISQLFYVCRYVYISILSRISLDWNLKCVLFVSFELISQANGKIIYCKISF